MEYPDNTVLILDFGSQYTQLIARRCREEGVFSRIEPFDFPLESIKALSPVGLILSGGPNSVYEPGSPQRWDDLATLDVPALGICYGMHIMVNGSSGRVTPGDSSEYGRATVRIEKDTQLLAGLSAEEPVWMSHRDRVETLPPGWKCSAVSDSNLTAAVEAPELGYYGVQFHPEVSHTPSGDRILRNFLYEICKAAGGWNMSSFARNTIEELESKLLKGRVICGLSGGVDSSVAATLVHKAVGDRLRCVFVDNGLLRKNEAQQVEELFRPRFGDGLTVVDAGSEFLSDIAGVSEPEKKRVLIGHRFIEVFRREAVKFDDAEYLVQGTLYPDVIESASTGGPAAVIKTHHNVGGLPADLGLKLIEPLRDLFKDEVREVGRELGLPESILMRHPFPGPGLAVRILGEVTRDAVRIVQEADAIFIEELRCRGWYDKVSQALVVLLPVNSVGVSGDYRTYKQVVALRSVDTRDFMTADFSLLPHDLLANVSSRITNEVDGVNRVVYDITSKPPGTVEWE